MFLKTKFNPFYFFILVTFYLGGVHAYAQQVPIGNWKSHLPYSKAIAVADAGDKVYCATRSGIFSYNKTDESTERISTINGLAEVSVTAMKYNAIEGILVIGYASGNIDLIQGNEIINMPFIKNKNITGGKGINNITMIGKFAYVSCDFGIVIINLDKLEISDTYYLGPSGNPIKVNDVAFDNSFYYAATDVGIYKGWSGNNFLSNYQSWAKDTTVRVGKYNTLAHFDGKIFANFSLHTDTMDYDTIFVYSQNTWIPFTWDTQSGVRRIETSYEKLVITNFFSSSFYDASGTRTNYVSYYDDNRSSPWEAVSDKDGTIWIADEGAGLVKNQQLFFYWILTPDGPENSTVWTMSQSKNTLTVSSGALESNLTASYTRNGLHLYQNNEWTSFTDRKFGVFDSVNDIIATATDPRDDKHVFAGSWGKGLLEFNNGTLIAIYGEDATSTIKQGIGGTAVLVGGLTYDDENNLWITNSGAANPLSVLRKDGTWQSFNLAGLAGSNHLGPIIIDSYKQKWIILPRGGGLVAYDDVNNSGVKLGTDNLPTTSVTAVASDLDGQIWIGTTEGVLVIYSPGNVASGGSFTAEKILVQQDGHTEYLLEKETVTAITIDGANRKWLGTAGGGVFLMSTDGTQQILHFSVTNSPLISNTIRCISIDKTTGEVFFGTDKGIMSYRGTATEGSEEMSDVVVFPNPVRENYTGLIGIKGLTRDADVKITDIAGNLVYATNAYGGQAVWDGKNLKGEKAQTGVYLVFCSNPDGKKRFVAKIFFIN